MTLSSWLRDYLYVPSLAAIAAATSCAPSQHHDHHGLGGLAPKQILQLRVSGPASHGAALVVERLFERSSISLSRFPGGRLSAVLAWLITFHFVCVTWVFFRSPSLEAAQAYFSALARGDTGWGTTITPLVAAMLAVGAATQIMPDRWFV
jgi:D-alanyl-lipoteichoic acid acyltransferase DltB (MBOAT superfamily)